MWYVFSKHEYNVQNRHTAKTTNKYFCLEGSRIKKKNVRLIVEIHNGWFAKLIKHYATEKASRHAKSPQRHAVIHSRVSSQNWWYSSCEMRVRGGARGGSSAHVPISPMSSTVLIIIRHIIDRTWFQIPYNLW